LGAGFVPIRKPKKLPAETERISYELEYGMDTLEMHKDAVKPGMRVVIADDLLATGGTALASVRLVEKLGGIVSAVTFVIELEALKGRDRLTGYDVVSLMKY
jgi:adenine phosphoribosyltransferase